jgi:hypothetical protein
MNSSAIRTCIVALVAVLVGVVLYLGYRGWRNFRTYTVTERVVREALNEHLQTYKIDAIAVVDIPGGSRLFGVPEVVKIDHKLFRATGAAGRQPAGYLSGKYNRKTGQIVVGVNFNDGKRALDLNRQLQSVP